MTRRDVENVPEGHQVLLFIVTPQGHQTALVCMPKWLDYENNTRGLAWVVTWDASVLPAGWTPYAYQEITAPDPAEAPEEVVV